MYASKMPSGKLYLESKPKEGAVSSFEFSMEDIPVPPDPEKEFELKANFDTETFYLVEKIRLEPTSDPTPTPTLEEQLVAAYREGVASA